MTCIKKKKVFVLFGLLLCLTGLAHASDWTFLVYLDGDNNLESAGIDDFLEMASVGSSSDVKIVVLFDRIPGESSSYGDWTDTRRGLVSKNDVPSDGNDGKPAWGTSMGELNMGNRNTLIDFVEWGMQNYPASKYAVILWNHGSGWRLRLAEEELLLKAVCWDDTDGGDTLLMSELRGALDTIETDEEEPNLVGFDACLMAMAEVAYEIREHASVKVGSEKTEPGSGWPYDTILDDLVDDPTMSAAELGTTIVTRYHQSESETQSGINLVLMNALATEIDSFAQTLSDDWNSDIGACAAAAYPVMMDIDSAVFAEEHGSWWPGSHGLAIYFPETSGEFNTDYTGGVVLLAQDTRWEEFLQDFYTFMAGSWVADARDQSQEYDASAAAGVQGWHIDLYDFCEKLIDNASGVIWVDFAYVGTENGTFDQPYNTLAEAVTAASSGETICIKPSSSDENITITKAMTLRASGGTAIIGL